MTSISIRVLQGMGQGRVYSQLQLPVSLGREDGNTVQLNDDQVSRYHARIQERDGRIIVTDLQSLNGTCVNGHPVEVRILQIGDVLKIGRCVLLFSERHVKRVRPASNGLDDAQTAYIPPGQKVEDDSNDWEIEGLPEVPSSSSSDPERLFPDGRPELPTELNTLQRIQLSDLLSHLHERLGVVVKSASDNSESENDRNFEIDRETWNKLLALQVDLLDYMDEILQKQHSTK